MATATYDNSRDSQQESLSLVRSGVVKNVTKDMIGVVSLGVLLLCVHEFGVPFQRGFHCNDETIRYPFKESTVSSGLCYAVGSGLNILLIFIVEYLALTTNQSGTPRNGSPESASNSAFQGRIYLRNVYCRLVVWLFGGIASELLTDIAKFTSGRLRPHFIDVCKPIVFTETSKVPLSDYCRTASDPYRYLLDYECSGEPRRQRDARLSFLSGHSSYSAFSAIYAVYYIQSSLDITKIGMIKPVFQVLIISAAFYTGLTRVSDYKHHWQDVLAGLSLGTTVAFMVHRHVWPTFSRTYSKYIKTQRRTQPAESGEELNNFSY